jgi:hypothetical protein
MKNIFYISALVFLLFGRDNPFENNIQDSNDNNEFSSIYLQEEKIFLPDRARELESIIIQYKALDGSKEIKKVLINSAIDWHIPIILKQDNKNSMKNTSFHAIEYVPFNFIKYKISTNTIYIYTRSKKLRHFHLPRPFKIILDFDSNFRFKTLSKEIKRSQVVSISTGSHKEFFRVSILLDAPYKYNIEQTQSGYKITLH